MTDKNALSAFEKAYLRELKNYRLYMTVERGLAVNTITSYDFDLRALLDFLRPMELEGLPAIKQEHLTAFLASLFNSGQATSSMARHISAFRGFFKYLHREKVIPKNPTLNLDLPRKAKKLPEVLTEEQVEMLLQAPDRSTALGQRDWAMFELMYATGLRVSELVSLPVNDYNGLAGFVRVIGKGSKERIAPVGQYAVHAVDFYLANGRREQVRKTDPGILFLNHHGKPLTRQGFWLILKQYAEQLGFAVNLKPHILRHSVATHLLGHGADIRVVQELLGHENISTTQIYTHLSDKQLRRIYEDYHPRAHLED